MADKKRYQVVAACAILPVESVDGPVIRTLYAGAVFDGDPNNVRVAHNVDSGYVVALDRDAVPGVDAAGTPLVDDRPTVGDGNAGDPVSLNDPGVVNAVEHQKAVDATRAAEAEARKGGRPSNADKAKLVDQAVAAGMDHREAEKASVAELRAALKS